MKLKEKNCRKFEISDKLRVHKDQITKCSKHLWNIFSSIFLWPFIGKIYKHFRYMLPSILPTRYVCYYTNHVLHSQHRNSKILNLIYKTFYLIQEKNVCQFNLNSKPVSPKKRMCYRLLLQICKRNNQLVSFRFVRTQLKLYDYMIVLPKIERNSFFVLRVQVSSRLWI